MGKWEINIQINGCLNSSELLSFIFSLAAKLDLFKGHIKIPPRKLHSKKESKFVVLPFLTMIGPGRR